MSSSVASSVVPLPSGGSAGARRRPPASFSVVRAVGVSGGSSKRSTLNEKMKNGNRVNPPVCAPGGTCRRRCSRSPPLGTSATSSTKRDGEAEPATVKGDVFDDPDDPSASLSCPRDSPASTTFPIPEKGTGVVAWHPHMTWLFRRLEDALGPLTVVPIPPDLAAKTAPGKAHSRTWVYSSAHARRIRFTYVDAGANAQIFNCVVYPRCDGGEEAEQDEEGKEVKEHVPDRSHSSSSSSASTGTSSASGTISEDTSSSSSSATSAPSSTCLGDAPLLGVDLLCLAGGKKVLVGVDLQPLSRDEEYLARYAPDLAAVREERFADLNLVEPSKKFYEDAQYFSPAMLFARPEASAMASQAAVTASAAAGADFPVSMEACELDADCGVELLQDRVLDAVKLYTEAFLRTLDVKRVEKLREEECEGGESTGGGGGGGRGGGFGSEVIKSVDRSDGRSDMASVGRSAATTDESDVAPSLERAELDLELEEPPAVSMWDGDDGEEAVEAVEAGELENTTAREVARAAKEEAAELRGEVDGDEVAAAAAATGAAPQRTVRILSPMETAAAQDGHDDWQRARDPAVPMFASYFGKEWAERMAEEVLFPRGLAVAELVSKQKELVSNDTEQVLNNTVSKPRREDDKDDDAEEEE